MILSHGDYDAKTLIRYAMQALDDEFGINEAWGFVSKIRDVFFEVREYERKSGRHTAALRQSLRPPQNLPKADHGIRLITEQDVNGTPQDAA